MSPGHAIPAPDFGKKRRRFDGADEPPPAIDQSTFSARRRRKDQFRLACWIVSRVRFSAWRIGASRP